MGDSSVKSAERTLTVLLYLASKAQPVPTMTIARDVGLPRSSAYHLLNVMKTRNFVAYYPDERRWGLGVAAFEIGSAYLRSRPLERLARPILAALVQEVGEAAHLGVLHGGDALYIAKHHPPGHPMFLVADVGVRLPAPLTAIGKAMLMQQGEQQVRATFPASRPLANNTGRGPKSQRELLQELVVCRERGFAFEEGNTAEAVSCIAAPVFGADGRADAGISISYWSPGYDARGRKALADRVRNAADQLSDRLGWHSSRGSTDEGAEAS